MQIQQTYIFDWERFEANAIIWSQNREQVYGFSNYSGHIDHLRAPSFKALICLYQSPTLVFATISRVRDVFKYKLLVMGDRRCTLNS